MNKNQATAAQARFIESLAKQVGKETFNQLFEKACAVNGNSGIGDTVTQKVRRLTKKVASQLIEDLLAAKDNQ